MVDELRRAGLVMNTRLATLLQRIRICINDVGHPLACRTKRRGRRRFVNNDSPRPNEQSPPEDDCLVSADLLRGRKTVRIQHGGEVYVLRVTRSGKLILTK